MTGANGFNRHPRRSPSNLVQNLREVLGRLRVAQSAGPPCRHHAPICGAPTVQVRMSCERHLSKTGFHVKEFRVWMPAAGILRCRPPICFFVDSSGKSRVRHRDCPVVRTVRHIPSRFGGGGEAIAGTPGTGAGQARWKGEPAMRPDSVVLDTAAPEVVSVRLVVPICLRILDRAGKGLKCLPSFSRNFRRCPVKRLPDSFWL